MITESLETKFPILKALSQRNLIYQEHFVSFKTAYLHFHGRIGKMSQFCQYMYNDNFGPVNYCVILDLLTIV